VGCEVIYESNFKECMSAFDEKARERMMEASVAVHKQTVENLTGNRSGRWYNVPGTRKKYQASSESEMPASATGILRKTVKWGVEGEGTTLTGFVGTEQKYGPMLEFGTKHMRPRPWLRRTFEDMEGKIKESFTRIWF
jgi:HK97 gp10 family phage protein